MKRWEYRVIDSRQIPGSSLFRGKKAEETEKYLNRMGQEGWEIINLDFNDMAGQVDFVGIAKRECEAG